MGNRTFVGGLELTEEPDRLVIRQRWGEFVGCLIIAPLFGSFSGFMIYITTRYIFSIVPSTFQSVLELLGSLFLSGFFGCGVLVCCWAILYGVLYGRRTWILDRSEDVFRVHKKRIRPLSSITHVAVFREQRAIHFYEDYDNPPTRYAVFLAPTYSKTWLDTILGVDSFGFGENEADAKVFGRTLARFLNVRLVPPD
jgi:hypothetical protein